MGGARRIQGTGLGLGSTWCVHYVQVDLRDRTHKSQRCGSIRTDSRCTTSSGQDESPPQTPSTPTRPPTPAHTQPGGGYPLKKKKKRRKTCCGSDRKHPKDKSHRAYCTSLMPNLAWRAHARSKDIPSSQKQALTPSRFDCGPKVN